MKILMISDPSSIHTSNWYDGIRSKGHDVEILFPKEWIHNNREVLESIESQTNLLDVPSFSRLLGDSLKKLAIPAVLYDFRNRTSIHQSLRYIGKQIHEYAIEGKFDFIHAHGMATSALLANASGFRPYSASAWGSDIYLMPNKYPYLRKLIAKAAAEAAFVHVESVISANHLRNLSPNMENKVLISTWGVDTNLYKIDIPPSKLLETLNIRERNFILSFRSLEPIYRIHLIIQAFAIVAKENENLVLVIAGDGSLKSELVNLAKELGLESKVVFTGYVDNELKVELFSRALMYVQCPESDGVALAMMEAMSSGQPLISSNVGDTSVLIEPGINGFLIDDVTPQNLAQSMMSIMKDKELRERMSLMSRKIAIEKHDRSAFFESFIDAVHDAVQLKKD